MFIQRRRLDASRVVSKDVAHARNVISHAVKADTHKLNLDFAVEVKFGEQDQKAESVAASGIGYGKSHLRFILDNKQQS